MTGWMLFVAILAAYIPGHDLSQLQHALRLDGVSSSAAIVVPLGTLIIGMISAPFIGFSIGGMAIGLLYLFAGHPYNSEGRRRLKSALLERRMLARDTKKVLTSAGADECFVYFYYGYCPSSVIEWSRRRRTSQFLGYNWLLAAIIGTLFGLLTDWWSGSCAWTQKIPWIGGVFLVVLFAFYISLKAGSEAENIERIWIEEFLRHPPDEFKPRQSTKRRQAKSTQGAET